jgi:serine/threonine-protein kinase HipA
VYITLPGQTAPVTAARFTLTRDRAGNARGQFRYGQSYLARPDCVALDPLELKLSERTYHTTRLRGVFGALRDASPDAWGRRVIERHAGHSTLGEINYLLHGPDDRAGALGFGLGSQPPAPSRKYNDTLDLARLQQLADTISNDEPLPVEDRAAQIEDLMLIGTSMGGARPKAVVEDAEGLWIAKFNRPDDRWNHARVEHAMLTLARECGIDAGRSKITSVGGRDVLLVQRFDRRRTDAGYLRARMISALTLLRSDDTPQDRGKWSYPLLVEELRRISGKPADDAAELFRRMCFNAMISNTDDHPRNHAVIAWNQQWRISPAYDLTPYPHVSVEHRDLAMICGDAGRYANVNNLLSQSARFLMPAADARSTLQTMAGKIATWYEHARAAGVSDADCERIAGAFLYPGLHYPARG